MTVPDPSADWWTPQEAARQTGFHEETLRKWSRSDPPRVRSSEATVGKQRRVLLHKDDVLREAAKSAPRASRSLMSLTTHDATSAVSTPEATLRARVSVLEEVLRRRRVIDEHRQEIERNQKEIVRHLQEIEELLLGPSWVPND